MSISRPNWDDTWMAVARAVSLRSECMLSRYGCVITNAANRIIATGYNGPPAGYPATCGDAPLDGGCPHRVEDRLRCISTHAEANALLWGDRSVREGGTLYVNGTCCWACGVQIANSGLARVVMTTDGWERRDGSVTKGFMEKSGLLVDVWPS